MSVVPVAMAVLTVMAVQAIWPCVPLTAVDAIHGFYAIDPLLILHFDPTLLERASLLAGRAYSGPPGGRQARNNGSRICGKIGRVRALDGATAAGSSWRSRPPPEARSRPAPNRAGRRPRRRGGRRSADFSRIRVEGPERAAQDLDLELVEGVERGPAALDRAAPPLGRVVLALQRDQRVDAADGAERRRRLRRLSAPRPRRPRSRRTRRGAARTRSQPGRWRSIRRCACAASLGDRNAEASRNTAKGGPVWLTAGK